MTTPMLAIDRRFVKCVSCFAVQRKYSLPTSCHRRSSPAPPSAPTKWKYGAMPLASVSFSHMRASSALFDKLRHPGDPVEYAAVTLAANFPSRTELQTRPCRLHPHTSGSSQERP